MILYVPEGTLIIQVLSKEPASSLRVLPFPCHVKERLTHRRQPNPRFIPRGGFRCRYE
jgi:hypothetical protein